MKILAISDRKPDNLKQTLEENNFDLIITLWDLSYFDIMQLEMTKVPKIWVYWNHCSRDYMEMLWIQDLHLKTFEFNWLIFGGFEWCVRYKKWDHIMYTQEEANELIKKLPKVDVLITHCPPRFINDNDDEPHHWFEALSWYIENFSPKYLFHGHTYNYWHFITGYKNTKIFYIEKWKIIDL